MLNLRNFGGNIWISSDLHLGHDKEFLYGPRGFSSIEEHDAAIIKNFNKYIRPEDMIILLGDVIVGDWEEGFASLCDLNCEANQIYLVYGNHDTDAKIDIYQRIGINLLGCGERMRYGKYHFLLSHYPTLTSNYDDGKSLKEKVVNLCGHSHTEDRFADWDKGCIYHCELDAHDNKPILITDIIEDLKEKYYEN